MSTILVNSGKSLDLTNILPTDICAFEIAHALSNICRFTGHVDQFYSVAQHSVLVSKLVPKTYALQALLHDATEAYLGDVSAPLKALLPQYKVIEAAVWESVVAHFKLDITPQSNAAVADADKLALYWEIVDLFSNYKNMPKAPPSMPRALIKPIKPQSPSAAKRAFLLRFLALTHV